MGGKSQDVEVTDYFMAIHFGVCAGPIDEFKEIWIGEKLAWSGSAVNSGPEGSQVNIIRPDLFGGSQKEGGVVGGVIFRNGAGFNDPIAELMSRLKDPETGAWAFGPESPGIAYRGVANVFFKELNGASTGFMWSTNYAVIRDTWFKVKRSPKPRAYLNSLRMIGEDANPAAIILECLLSKEFGMWAQPENIDITSFEYAAQLLQDENFGLSLMWVQQDTIEEFINVILSHINAVVFVSPRTGLLTLKLLRGDYDAETLQEITPKDCKLQGFKRRSWGEVINEVIVKWTNPVNEESEAVSVQDGSNIAMQGSLVSKTMEMPGIRTAELALRVAQRELQMNATPILSIEIVCKRFFYDFEPGDVFKFTWPRHGINQAIMRVTQVNYGAMGSDEITIQAKEDLFGMPESTFFDGQPGGWVDPAEDPAPPVYSTAVTVPYQLLHSFLNVAPEQMPEYPTAITAALVTQTGSDTYAYDMWGERTADGQTERFLIAQHGLASRGTLESALTKEVDSVIKLNNLLVRARVRSGAYLWIGLDDSDQGEWVQIYNSDSTGLHIHRGLFDTVPQEWPVDTPVWVVDSVGLAIDKINGVPIEHADGETVRYWALTKTSKGTLAMDQAPAITTVANDRAYLPYRPGNVKVNGLLFPDEITSVDLAITWSHRNKDLELAGADLWADASASLPAGVTYTVEIYNAVTDTLIKQENGITGEAFSYPAAQETLDTGALAKHVRVVVYAVHEVYGPSWQAYEQVIERPVAEWGNDWGNTWGA